ncbi:hydrolase [Demequina litorisediminis]|uniref:Hydrolase n=1 Tax=Demequina litorisediminis TaxID=1849022 RepID=A0ABQ6I9L4_9MICO|nr:hydrolase [Demequina litorisediminis]
MVIPGGPCRNPVYLGDLGGLAAHRPLAIVHVRGAGRTGHLSRGWWNDADDVLAVVDALGLEAPDVLAHSAGTRLAIAAATRFEGRFRSLALVTPAAAWLTGTAHDGAAVAARRKEPEVAAAVAAFNEPDPEDDRQFAEALRVQAPAGYARWAVREQRHAGLGASTLAAARAWFRDVPDDAAERVRAAALPPTLVVGGAEDILSGVEPVRAYADALGAGLAWIEKCGHYPWVERPQEFIHAVVPWCVAAR